MKILNIGRIAEEVSFEGGSYHRGTLAVHNLTTVGWKVYIKLVCTAFVAAPGWSDLPDHTLEVGTEASPLYLNPGATEYGVIDAYIGDVASPIVYEVWAYPFICPFDSSTWQALEPVLVGAITVTPAPPPPEPLFDIDMAWSAGSPVFEGGTLQAGTLTVKNLTTAPWELMLQMDSFAFEGTYLYFGDQQYGSQAEATAFPLYLDAGETKVLNVAAPIKEVSSEVSYPHGCGPACREPGLTGWNVLDAFYFDPITVIPGMVEPQVEVTLTWA